MVRYQQYRAWSPKMAPPAVAWVALGIPRIHTAAAAQVVTVWVNLREIQTLLVPVAAGELRWVAVTLIGARSEAETGRLWFL